MTEVLRILEPVPDATETPARGLARRVSSLRGKTVLLLDNRKPNAFELLGKVGALLKSEHGVSDVIAISKKPDYSRTVTLEELGQNIGKAHLAITALGD